MIVRDEQAGDVDAIFEVTRVAFLEPWYSSHTEQFIPSALRRAGVLTLSLVAEVDGRVVGHAAFSPVTMTDGSTGWFGLGPISVLPARQRQGIGKALIGEGLARLRALGAAGCVLVGDPEYYGRFGFRNVSGLVYPDAPAYAFQVLPFGDAIPQGVVHFHEGFEATSL